MSSPDPRIGTQLAGYRIERVVGRGGTAIVYLAEHVHLARKVALKVLVPELSEDEGFRDRFVRESRLAAALDHPNIIPVHDAGEHEGVLYIAMRYVEGTDLKGLLGDRGRLEVPTTRSILGPVASALDAAHTAGLVHRDVKPGNILIAPGSEPGGPERVYLTDFGLTKRVASDMSITRTGQFVGTIAYVAPEQIEGGEIDGRTDVYSMACVLYQCLAGSAPYAQERDFAVIYAHLRAPPPKATERRPELPTAVDDVIARGMAKKKEERFPTSGELMEAFASAVAGAPAAPAAPTAPTPPTPPAAPAAPTAPPPPAAEPPPPPEPPPPEQPPPPPEAPAEAPTPPSTPSPEADTQEVARPRRKRRWPLIAAAVVVAAGVAVGAVLFLRSREEPAPDGPGRDGPTVAGDASDLIAFTRPGDGTLNDLVTMDPAGGNQQVLVQDLASAEPPAWDTAHRRVAFDGGPGDDVYVVDVRTSEVTQLTDTDGSDGKPSWAPDGKIAFQSDRNGNSAIYFMDASGGDVQQLTFGDANDFAPSISPDGELLAFRSDRDGNDEIYVMDLTTGDEVNLTQSPSNEGAPSWSPDGSRIAFDSDRDGNREIYVMDADGSNVVRLTDDGSADLRPSWSPDGTEIAFLSDRDGGADVWVMGADGADPRNLTRSTSSESAPGWS